MNHPVGEHGSVAQTLAAQWGDDPHPSTTGARARNLSVVFDDLAGFLRARRSALSPESAGLARSEDRRVAGLRREEVAALAGVSVDYYRRLEQGRERHPSSQVLSALARALQLDAHAARHLFDMVYPPVQFDCPAAEVSDGIRLLIEHSLRVPASVIGPASEVLALNDLGAALYSPFERVDNLAEMVFLSPAAATFYADWDSVARASVANLRAASTQFPLEPRIAQIVGKLCVTSQRFAELWSEHQVRPRIEAETVFHHPDVGELRVTFESLSVTGVPGQRVYVYTPIPGTRGAQHLLEFAEDRRDSPGIDAPHLCACRHRSLADI